MSSKSIYNVIRRKIDTDKTQNTFISKKILTMTMGKDMEFKTIKVSEKGQIVIPTEIRKELKIKKGEQLLLIRKGRKIMIEKPEEISRAAKKDFQDMLILSESTLSKIWNNKEDEVWNKYLKKR